MKQKITELLFQLRIETSWSVVVSHLSWTFLSFFRAAHDNQLILPASLYNKRHPPIFTRIFWKLLCFTNSLCAPPGNVTASVHTDVKTRKAGEVFLQYYCVLAAFPLVYIPTAAVLYHRSAVKCHLSTDMIHHFQSGRTRRPQSRGKVVFFFFFFTFCAKLDEK